MMSPWSLKRPRLEAMRNLTQYVQTSVAAAVCGVVILWLAGHALADETLPPEPGPFERLLNEQHLVQPGIVSLGDLPPSDYRLPGDFEPLLAIILAGDRLAAQHPEVLQAILGQLPDNVKAYLLVDQSSPSAPLRRIIRNVQLPTERLRFIECPTDTIWIRDFGPAFVANPHGRLVAVDAEYQRRSEGKRLRTNDNRAAAAIARDLDVPLRKLPLILDGGNVLSNGRGLLVTTTASINRNIAGGVKPQTIYRLLRDHFGVEQLVLLEPLGGEITGHVDMFACFTDPQTIVVGQYAEDDDSINRLVLQRNVALLRKVRTGQGVLRVVPIAMPQNDGGIWRTFTNAVFANDILLMPNYSGTVPDVQRQTTQTFAELMPKRKIVGQPVDRLIKDEGALRCITLGLPRVSSAD